ncbi:MAG: nucleotide exchange factor GrpE [Candidatus Kapaibacterium sp.]
MDKNKSKNPLRSSSDKLKDLKNTYLKNEERSIPIHGPEEEEENTQSENMEAKEEKDIDQLQEEDNEQQQEIKDEAKPEPVSANAELEERVQRLEQEKEDLKDQLIRKAAELENIRRRSLKEKQEMMEYGNEKLLMKMLELLDDINNALEAGRKGKDYDALLQGVELINNKAKKLFEDSGVKPMEDPAGKPFDVDYHEAMMHIPSEVPEGHVVQEVQKGYMIKDKVLRHAKVITSAGKPE